MGYVEKLKLAMSRRDMIVNNLYNGAEVDEEIAINIIEQVDAIIKLLAEN
jgi:hypothetical protein